ncbi:hypothetical protein DOY81_014849 [Sarcophaga bullata]|nr:hypothetical protein DOY81_014849 [Sarcophaga bullata]
MKFTRAIACACGRQHDMIHIVSNPVKCFSSYICEYLKELVVIIAVNVSGSSSVDFHESQNFFPGRHSAGSIAPLLSQAKPDLKPLPKEEQEKLSKRIIHLVPMEVVKQKRSRALPNCLGSICVEDGFVLGLPCHSWRQKKWVMCPPMLMTWNIFCLSNLSLDENGIKELHKLPNMSADEAGRYCASMTDVRKSIDQGKKFVEQYLKKKKE